MKLKGANVFTTILKALDIKHTDFFSNKYFNEHPHKYNLLGISKLLFDYNIDNGGTIIEDKEKDIFEIQTPFIAQVGGEFAVVNKVSSENITYRMRGLNIKATTQEFCELWTGVVLLVEKNSDSIEPSYSKNSFQERFRNVLQLILLFAVFCVFAIGVQFNTSGRYSLMILNIIGIVISFFLLQKQLKINGRYSDKICSLFKQTDCNSILENKVAKPFGIFSLSEIGFGFFTSNLILVVFFPQLFTWYSLLSLLSLPFTIWSIWYQGVKIKQWCALCLIVQLLIWLNVAAIFIPEGLHLQNINFSGFLAFVCLYLIPFLVVSLLMSKFSTHAKTEDIIQEMNSLKITSGVLESLLVSQTYFESNETDSRIFFGKMNTPIVLTILSNPHCAPCGHMHKKIEDLLKVNPKYISVQYIFTSFNKELEISNKFLIAAYLYSKDDTDRALIFDHWFEYGYKNKESFFKKYSMDLESEEVEKEFLAHKSWKIRTQLDATPTILVNGHKLPPNYKIEDFRYISNLVLQSKREAMDA